MSKLWTNIKFRDRSGIYLECVNFQVACRSQHLIGLLFADHSAGLEIKCSVKKEKVSTAAKPFCVIIQEF